MSRDCFNRYPWRRIAATAASIAPSIRRTSGDNAGTDRPATTVTVDVALSFAGFASDVVDVTVAVFETGPAIAGNDSTRVTVAEPPLTIVPSVHVTVVVPAQLP